MKSIFNPEPYSEIKNRILKLQATTTPLWGKMNVAQMLAHCNKPLEVALGIRQIDAGGNFLIKLLFKKSLYNEVPYRKNLPTAKAYIIHNNPDFEDEKQKILNYLRQVNDLGLKHHWPDHPTFGRFTAEQHGQMIYKHLDHHLSQFNA